MSYDVVIIGSGPGGYVAAIRAAQLGLKVACVEKDKTFGGTCVNVGCIPSKALLESTHHYQFLTKEAKEHGIEAKATFNFDEMMKRKSAIVQTSTNGVDSLFKKNKIDTYQGTARLISPTMIEIGPNKTIETKNIILATGSEPAELPFLKFDEKTVISSTGALSLAKPPKSMIVIGGGIIGCELASVYNRLGTKVTVIEMLDSICVNLDRPISRMLLQLLQKQGIVFYLSSEIKSAKGNQLTFVKDGKEETLSADVILVAVGRKPYSKGLGLPELGIALTQKGFIPVDNNFRTVIPNIYAIGDLIDGPMLAHKASEEGVAAAEIIAGKTPTINYMTIPSVVYTHPEAASVGMTESEAKEAGLEIFMGSCPFRANGRARCMGEVEGMVKIIGEKSTGRVIGLHILGANASEMIHEGVIAIEQGATVHDIAYASHAHPTLSESIKEAALQALGQALNV